MSSWHLYNARKQLKQDLGLLSGGELQKSRSLLSEMGACGEQWVWGASVCPLSAAPPAPHCCPHSAILQEAHDVMCIGLRQI